MPFQINGLSMMDSYFDKEFIIVDRFSYRELPYFGQTQEIDRGDVVVFAPGVNEERKYFIKRVIGLPGESVKIVDGEVYIKRLGSEDFVILNEAGYLNDENNGHTYIMGDDDEQIFEVPEGEYFVMGDNRNHSTDSRTCFQSCSLGNKSHFILPSEIVGKVFLDLGYFDFKTLKFYQSELERVSRPRFFSSAGEHSYD